MTEAALARPRFAVLLATWNGSPWLEEQLQSIYAQREVDIVVIASDDASGDETPRLLADWSRSHGLSRLPTQGERFGNAARNFLRLLRDAPLGAATHVALSDQDDIWNDDKCIRAAQTLARSCADAYSSDVTAFWANGRQRLVRKSQRFRRFDHLFESAGPGCTFVFRRDAFERLRAWGALNFAALQRVKVHDWLFYAYARQQGWQWVIDPQPTVLYRQHQSNEIGVNAGYRPAWRRLQALFSGTYRLDALTIARAVDDKSWVTRALTRFTPRDRLILALSAGQLRRRWRDRLVLAVMLLFMRRA